MEKPAEPDVPLAILHHEEHLIFPGYDAMVGEGYAGPDEEDGRKPWVNGKLDNEPISDARGRSVEKAGLYKKHEKLLFAVGTIWCAVFALIPACAP